MQKYFDYAASTPVSQAVLEAMKPWYSEHFANPSAAHYEAEKAQRAIAHARQVIADEIGALPSEIVFTSGASEANNLALKGVAFGRLQDKGHIITSSIEHKCIFNTCSYLETLGFDVTYLKPNCDGLISPEAVKSALRDDTFLISIHHVNNELGSIQPIAEFGDIAFDNEVLFHSDAAQSFCKCSIDVDDMNIDMLSLSGHKIFGPKGVGALYVRDARESNLVPLIHGGGQELGLRGGTSPTPLIVGLGAAVTHFPSQASVEPFPLLCEHLEGYVVRRNGGDNTVPFIYNITFESDEQALKFFDDNQWLVSQGSACNAMSNEPSHVLSAIGLTTEEARRSYRISLPPYRISG